MLETQNTLFGDDYHPPLRDTHTSLSTSYCKIVTELKEN